MFLMHEISPHDDDHGETNLWSFILQNYLKNEV